jgi:uncharacterized protein
MRIVVMSDTHLDRVTDQFESLCATYCEGADMVIHLGDLVRSPVLDFLGRYPLEAVAGNMDDYTIRKRLPAKKVIQVQGHSLGIIHGWGSPVGLRHRLFEEFEKVEAILFGHTHQAIQIKERNIFWFNPGSVYHGRAGLSNSIGILNIEDRISGEIITL